VYVFPSLYGRIKITRKLDCDFMLDLQYRRIYCKSYFTAKISIQQTVVSHRYIMAMKPADDLLELVDVVGEIKNH